MPEDNRGDVVVTRRYERFAGACAIAVAIGGLAYSISFMVYLKSGRVAAAKVATFLLFGGGVLVMSVLIAVYARLRETDPWFALWALALGLVAAAGSSIHGAYDLANFVKHPVGAPAWLANLPNSVDPRGLMTFGLSGLSILVASWLILQGAPFPKRLGSLGIVTGLLLIVVYLGRLIILNPKNPVVLTAAILTGFVLSPLWFAWVGRELLQRSAPDPLSRAAG
jgi:hypothetical protein